ncbi:hypothetical protein [Streptomyces sp. KR55]
MVEAATMVPGLCTALLYHLVAAHLVHDSRGLPAIRVTPGQ